MPRAPRPPRKKPLELRAPRAPPAPRYTLATHPLADSLTAEQRGAVEAVLAGRSIFLSGTAGTGKSRTVTVIRDVTRAATSATTAAAAALIGGQTLHSLLSYAVGMHFNVWRGKPAAAATARLRGRSVIIIDESSMLDADTVDLAEAMLRVIGKRLRNIDAPWGGFVMVFVGDLFQLPPVNATSGMMVDAASFRAAHCDPIFLTRIFRQDDPLFIHLLECVRYAYITPLAALCAFVLEALYADAPPNVHALHIFTRRRACDAINVEFMSHFDDAVRFPVQWSLNIQALGRQTIRGRDVRLTSKLKEGTHEPLSEAVVALGSTVRVVKNIDQRRGLVNGALGVIVAVHPEKEMVRVRLDNGRIEEIGMMDVYTRAYRAQGEAAPVVDVGRCIPVVPAYGMTVFTAQGTTASGFVVADLSVGADVPGLVFTALSRATAMRFVIPRGLTRALPHLHLHASARRFISENNFSIAQITDRLRDESASCLPRAVRMLEDELNITIRGLTSVRRAVMAHEERRFYAAHYAAWVDAGIKELGD